MISAGDVGILRGLLIRDGEVPEHLGVLVGALHRLIIVSRHPHHLRAIGGDRFLPAGADTVVHVDHASAAEHAGAPRQRSPVVPRCRGGDGDLPRHRVIPAIHQVPGGDRFRVGRFPDFTLQHGQHCIDGARRLEAAHLEPMPFMLAPQAFDTAGGSETVQGNQRRRFITGEARHLRFHISEGMAVQQRPLRRTVLRRRVGPRIDGEMGRVGTHAGMSGAFGSRQAPTGRGPRGRRGLSS